MGRLEETKKLMKTQREINDQLFFFEFPIGQTKIKKKHRIIEAIGTFYFNTTDKIVSHNGMCCQLGELSFKLFYFIAKGEGAVISEPDIFDHTWVNRKYKQGEVSDMIRRIKNKMGDVICLQYGKGYYLNTGHGRKIKEESLRVA